MLSLVYDVSVQPALVAHDGLNLQTKNISGRLLVGLRYWNEVTDQGSNWRFETLEEVNPPQQS